MSSTATYSGGQELSSNTDVVSVKFGNGTWEYNSTWGVCETGVGNNQKPTLTNDIPTAGNYIVIVPTVDIAMTLDVRSQGAHNFYLVESTAPTTHIIDVRGRYWQTFEFGSASAPLKAGKTYYAYSAGGASLGYRAFTAKTVESYNIHYVDDSTTPVTIKDDVVYNGLYNDEVTASESDMANVTYESKVYTYTSGNETITLGTGTNEITLVYSTASQYDYTINAVSGGSIIQELATGTLYQGDTYGVYLKEVMTINSKQYVLDDAGNANINTYYAGYTMGDANATNEINYTIDNDVVALFECENMSYSHAHYQTLSSNQTASRYTASNGNAVCIYSANSITTTTTIPAGAYEIALNVCYKWRDNNTSVKLQYSTDKTEWNDITTWTCAGGVTGIKNVIAVIPSDSYLRLLDVTGATPSHFFDYLIVKKAYVSGTITDCGWSTFASSYPLDLSTISGGKTYYASAAAGSTVTLSTTTGTVPAGEGIMVKGTAGETFTINVAISGTAITGNLLKGQTTTGNVAASTDGTYHYVFGFNKTDASVYGFYNLAADTEVAEGKAYLETTTALTSGGARVAIVFDDEMTGLSTINREPLTDDQVYNLSGQRVSQPAKGLYITNGKKIILK